MKKVIRVFAGMLSVAMLSMLGIALALGAALPDQYYIAQGESFAMPNGLVRTSGFSQRMPRDVYSRAGNRYRMQLSLPGGAVIKTVGVSVVERDMVIPGGQPFGIKMFTDGVMVVGMSDFDLGGRAVNPAKSAGIRTGDMILRIDGQKVELNEDVGRIVAQCGGNPISVTLTRGGQEQTVELCPIVSPTDGGYKAGMWVRDSSAGIGTMTYYNPTSGVFVGLGHAICDMDTGEVMPLSSGEAVDVTITGVHRGVSGFPGELKGIFTGGRAIGALRMNGETGIYGVSDRAPMEAPPIPLAMRNEVQTGAAMIYTTVEGRQPQAYAVVIDRISTGDTHPTKNMVIHVTDQRLLDATGGIVQGMSGSPIIQNNRLVGAVTHVFVNDPTRGYAIFAENMERTAQESVVDTRSAA